MTVFLTIFAGVATFVLGQFVLKLLIDPIHEFRRTIADISHSLIEYADIYSNPGITGEENERKVSKEFRKLSSRLNAQMYLIPRYTLCAKLFGLPARDNVVKASRYLIGISNSIFRSSADLAVQNAEKADKICDALGIYVPEQDRVADKSAG